MAVDPSRFQITPAATYAAPGLLRGIGAIRSNIDRAKEKAEKDAKNAEFSAAMQSGDLRVMSEFAQRNPEYSQAVQQQFSFTNEQTKPVAIRAYSDVMQIDDPMAAADALDAGANEVESLGGRPVNMRRDVELLRSGDPDALKRIRAGAVLAHPDLIGGGAVGSDEAAFNRMLSGLSPKEKELARRIKLGLSPRAVGSASQTIADTGATDIVAESESVIEGAKAGAKEVAKLSAQFKLKPAVEAAVADAIAISKAKADQYAENRSNKRALEVYNTAMQGLSSAMESAYTGPIQGLIPALTADAQTADGAVAAMAPVLKQMFRAAGEGVFTDRDQQLLLDMVPTRKDHPETRAAKIKNIDALVMAKLGNTADAEPSQTAPPEGGVLVQDANGNRAWRMPDGSYRGIE